MALIPTRKTYPQLTAQSLPVQDGDILAGYRSPGPLKRFTASNLRDYLGNTFASSAALAAGTGSALVGFGNRTLASRLDESPSITDSPFNAVGNGTTNDAPAFNAAQATVKSISIPPATYRISSPITLTNPIEMDGNNRFSSILDAAGISGAAITVPKWLTGGGSIRNITLKGGETFGGGDIGLSIGTSVPDNVIDSLFDNIRIQGFSLGLDIQYAWDVSFRQIRVQNCSKPLALGSQGNAMTFDTCQLVSFTQAIELTNVEGVLFASLDMSNYGGTVDTPALTMFQSNAQFINPYFENIGNISVRVGSTGETLPSQLTIIGGVVDGLVQIGGQRASIKIEGCRWLYGDTAAGATTTGTKGNVICQPLASAPTIYTTNLRVELDNDVGGRNKQAFALHPYNRAVNENPMFGGELLAITRGREFNTLSNSATTEKGWRIATGLTVGSQYTFVYAIRRPSGVSIGTVNDGSQPASDCFSLDSEAWEIRYMPFIAAAANFGLSFDGTIEYKFANVYRGIQNSTLSLDLPGEWYAQEPPASISGWLPGDHIFNLYALSNSYVGWVNNGSSWRPFGALA